MKKILAQKILLIATRQIGDVLLVTPLLRSIRRAYPQAIIDVLVYDHKGGMLEGNPDYDRLISVAEHPRFSQYKKLLSQIGRQYDLAISTLAGDRPIVYAWLAAPQRVSLVPKQRWQDGWKRWLVQHWTEFDPVTTHTVIQNLRLADLLAIPRYYDLVLPQTKHARVQSRLPFAWQQTKFAVLHLLPMWHYKRWTLTGWQQLAHYFVQQGWYVVLTGGNSQEEQTYIEEALSAMPNQVINLAGQLRFSEVAELIRASQIYVGPDTAVTHLAAATGVPTVALYGPTNPLKWAPWPSGYHDDTPPFKRQGMQKVNNVLLIQGPGPCVPCHQEGCHRHKKSKSRCLAKLEAATVIQAIINLMVNDFNGE